MIHSDGAGMPYLHQKAGGSRMPPTAETVAQRLHYVHQEGATVYKFAVARMAEVAGELMTRNGLTPDMIDWLVPHQANKRIIEATAERMSLPMERVMIVIHKYGNTTAATIPLCLWDYERAAEGRRPAAHGRVRRRLHLGRSVRHLGLRRGRGGRAQRLTRRRHPAPDAAGSPVHVLPAGFRAPSERGQIPAGPPGAFAHQILTLGQRVVLARRAGC